jgi:Alpha/beta hydrolase
MRAYGANIEEMSRTQQAFTAGTRQLESSTRIITSLIGQTYWLGPVATTFVDQWNSVHAPALRRVGAILEGCAHTVVVNRDEQIQASADGGGVERSLVGPRFGQPQSAPSIADRVAANRKQMEADLASGVGDATLIKELLKDNVKVLVWDPQHGRIATVQGDIDTAELVVITVPGTGAKVSQYTAHGKETERARLRRPANQYQEFAGRRVDGERRR